MTEYKALLHLWHKGTGGGPGLDIYFESWSDEKKEKYSIDTETYDHSNVAERPAILIENYSHDTVKKPYLTVIHMWDELSSHLLSSKHDPFVHKKGEIGIALSSNDDSESDMNTSADMQSTSSSNRKRSNTNSVATPVSNIKRRKKKRSTQKDSSSNADDNDIRGAIKAIINMNNPKQTEKKSKDAPASTRIEDLSLNELFEQMDNHKNHLKFLQDNSMCSTEEKAEIVSTIKEIYTIVSSRTKSNKYVS